jgi:preprotein translocase subunit SecE
MALATTAPRNPFRRVALFVRETIDELRKASWPDLQELKTSTIIVIIAVVLLGLFISVSDFSIFELVTFLTRAVAQ